MLPEILLLLLAGGGGARRGVPEEEGLSILHDVRILHRRVIVLLLLKEFLVLLLLSLKLGIKNLAEFVNPLKDKNAFPLRAGFGFANE